MLDLRETSVYSALQEHQTTQQSWCYQSVIQEFHRWHAIFNVEFKLDLSPTVIRIGGARSGCYGHFRPSHNDFGLPREIAFNERHLRDRVERGDFWQALGTLLHELLHAWQFDHGLPSSRNYHNAELREKALQFGLAISRAGYTEYVPNSPFFQLLSSHGVVVPVFVQQRLISGASNARGPGSKLKKWSCRCTNVRVAVENFRAQCLNCGQVFVPSS